MPRAAGARRKPRTRADPEVRSLEELLERADRAGGKRTSVEDVMEAVGSRSFGPLLLLPGLVMVAPVVGDIPGVPVMMGLFVVLATSQLLFGRDHVWLPRWLLRRSVASSKVHKGVSWLLPVGRFFDRLSRRRLEWLIHGPGLYAIGILCTLVALATPAMEIVPMSANVAGVAIATFGLALIARDGIVAVCGFAFSLGLLWLLVSQLI
jgi:hypothetical protein